MGKCILLIELSATLRHAAKKLMVTAGYSVTEARDFGTGLKLVSNPGQDATYDGVVMGWPAKTDTTADELFTLLMEPEYAAMAVIVLSYQADLKKLTWVSKRSNTAIVAWDEYSELIQSLSALIAPNPILIQETLPQLATESMRVLFVDDSPTVRATYRKLLVQHGYIVDTACGVVEGMEKAIGNRFDIVISDYYMLDGTGDTLCAKLRDDSRTSHIVTAILTGTYSDQAIISSLAAGAVECMFKDEAKQLFLARIDAMSRSLCALRGVKNEHKYLEGILTSVGDGVYGVDRDGVITFINPAAKKILGFTTEEVFIGKTAFEAMHDIGENGAPIAQEDCYLFKAYRNGEEFNSWVTMFKHKGNKSIPVECTVFPLYVNDELRGSVVAFRDVSERKLLLEEIKWRATHDPLTKLPNRSHFESQLFQEVERLQRSQERSLLLYIDLDRFKYLNDTAGHATGDQLLTTVGRHLRKRLRVADLLARIGGDEFAVILRNVKPDTYIQTADKFREILSKIVFSYGDKVYTISVSIGVAVMEAKSGSAGEMLSNADIACYVAKSMGRNTTHLYNPQSDARSAMDIDLGWSTRLQDALKDERFILYYQPILNLNCVKLPTLPNLNGELWKQCVTNGYIQTLQYEVLLRMLDTNGSLVNPDQFIPTAERFNMMADIDRWVIKKSIEKLSGFRLNEPNIRISINLSAQSLDDDNLADYIVELVQEYRVDPGALLFEITETSAIANLDKATRFVSALHGLGFKFALDDFGSGFCSFSHLKYLPVDEIKIDGIFIQGMLNDTVDRAIISSVVHIGHSVGKKTVAEFVDDVDILRELQRLGVDSVQGNYIAKPQAEIAFDLSKNIGNQKIC